MDEARSDGGIAGKASGGVPARVSMVVLSARDLPALRRFYLDLGWTEQAGGSDTLAIFPLGAVSLALYPHAVGATPPDDTSEPVRSAITLVVRVGSRDTVDSAFAEAVRAGAQPVSDPEDQSFGGRSAVVADPEGNRWELLWSPGAAGNG
jgi:hypothetical protein